MFLRRVIHCQTDWNTETYDIDRWYASEYAIECRPVVLNRMVQYIPLLLSFQKLMLFGNDS